MPQIPYDPVPDIQPTREGPAPLRIETPGAAFGTNVAAAVSSVGGDLNKVGDELFARAMAIQDLTNRADADKASQEFDEEAAPIHANFNALQGADRVAAQPKYIQDINNLRDKKGEGLNPTAKRYYESQSRGQSARMIFSSAVQTADANKQYLLSNATAQEALYSKQVGDQPENETLYETRVQDTKNSVATRMNILGIKPGDARWELEERDAVSRLTRNRLITENQEHQPQAMEMFERLKTKMNEADKDAAYNTIVGHGKSIAEANIANEAIAGITDENGNLTGNVTQAENKIRLQARTLYKDDPVVADRAVSTFRTLIGTRRNAEMVDDAIANQKVYEYIYQHPEIQTAQQLRAVPEMAQVLDAMNNKGKGLDAPGMLERKLEAKFRTANEKRWNELYAMSIDDPQKFLDIDPTKAGISDVQVHAFLARRAQLIKSPQDDPHLTRAIGWMQGAYGTTLQNLGVATRTSTNADDYYRYTGSLYGAIQAWREANGGKIPTESDVVKTIGPQVLKDNVRPGTFYGEWHEPQFKVKVPAEISSMYRKTHPNATDDQIRIEYNNALYQKMFGQHSNVGAKGDLPEGVSPTTATVPRSQ